MRQSQDAKLASPMWQRKNSERTTLSWQRQNGPPCQILTNVVEEVKISINRDIKGADLLYDLLNTTWLQSLFKVYERLQLHSRTRPGPHLSYASGLSRQMVEDLHVLATPTAEALELSRLLRDPHLQALLSAHDSVAQGDYGPVLPPVPDDLPEDEEAVRIVCLVKNKQPLRSVGGGARSHWDNLRHLTKAKLASGGGARLGGSGGVAAAVSWDTRVPSEPLSASLPGSPRPLRHLESMTSCKLCPQTRAFFEEGLSQSVPSICTSGLMDDVVEETDSGEDESMRGTVPPLPQHHPRFGRPISHCRIVGGENLHSGSLPESVARCTCPEAPSPRLPPRVSEDSGARRQTLEPARRGSLEELRYTVWTAASTMEHSTQDVRQLGRRMAAATELMSESVQGNAQALSLLAEVVDKLQGLVVTSGAADGPRLPPWTTPPSRRSRRSSSASSSSSSSASSSSLRAYVGGQKPSQGKVFQDQPSPRKSAPRLLSNGLGSALEQDHSKTGCLFSKKKKKKKE